MTKKNSGSHLPIGLHVKSAPAVDEEMVRMKYEVCMPTQSHAVASLMVKRKARKQNYCILKYASYINAMTQILVNAI